ncbi:unnamed protein product [Rhizoctonia solani]|nr:unnamed protein product [Rhizoctonia solani]
MVLKSNSCRSSLISSLIRWTGDLKLGLKVVVKAGSESESSARTREALYSMTQHEIALVAQIDHPCIQRLLGIDSSATHTHMPDMVFESLSQVTLAHVCQFEDIGGRTKNVSAP